MEVLFLKVLNMSIAAGWMIAAVLVLRLLLRKAPKSVRCILWALVGFRLICPFSVESVLSLIPSAEPVPREIMLAKEPAIESGFEIVNKTVNPLIAHSFAPAPGDSANPLQIAVAVASVLWAAGMAVMLLYALISCVRLRRQVAVSMRLEGAEENIWIGDGVRSPFIFGILFPRIYLPSALEDSQAACIIAHEKAHLKRRDHWWKPLGYFLLSLYWFQPLCWIAYILLCQDIELACDERVVKGMSNAEKKAYAQVLLACGSSRHTVSACPLAFGETGIRKRVRNVLYYKKPSFWILLAAAGACVVAVVCFLTNPATEKEKEMFGARYSVAEVLYNAPWFDAAYSPDSAPEYIYTEDRSLLQKSYGGILGYNEVWNMMGVFREMEPGGTGRAGFLLSDGQTLSAPVQGGGISFWEGGILESIPGLDGEAGMLLEQVEHVWYVNTDMEGFFYLVMQTRDGQVLQAACFGEGETAYIRWFWKMKRQPAEGDMEYFAAMIESMCGDNVQIFALYESDSMPDRLVAGFEFNKKDGKGYAVFQRNKTSDGWRIYGFAGMGRDALSCVTLGEDWGFDHSVTIVLSSRGDLTRVTARTDGGSGQEMTAGVNGVPAMCVFEWEGLLSAEEAEALSVQYYGAQDKELE